MKEQDRVISFVPRVRCVRCGQYLQTGESFEKQVSPDKIYVIYHHKPQCPNKRALVAFQKITKAA